MKQAAKSLAAVLPPSLALTGVPVEQRLVPRRTRFGILVVMVDSQTRASITDVIDPRATRVEATISGANALALARAYPFDLILIGQQLPDMSGMDLVLMLRKEEATANIPFILVSGADTSRIALEAIRLSAPTVMIDRDKILRTSSDETFQSSRAPAEQLATGWPKLRPRSAAERWAMLVLKACESEGDLRTLDDWAAFVGVSYSSLCECCRMIVLRPHDARDFGRVLNAVLKAVARRCHPSVLLDVSDRRTLRNILQKAGLGLHEGPFSVEQFFRSQKFIPSDNEGLNVLRALLAAR